MSLTETEKDALYRAVNVLVDICHGKMRELGWWTDLSTGEHIASQPRVFQEKAALIHSEISEALEGHRKGLKDDKLPSRDMDEVELADAIIRIVDTAGGFGMDLAGALAEKMEYNMQRADHKIENRKKEGGKKY